MHSTQDTYFVLGKNGSPAVRGSFREMNHGPANGQLAHARRFHTDKLAISSARSKPLGKGSGTLHVFQVLILVGKLGELCGCVLGVATRHARCTLLWGYTASRRRRRRGCGKHPRRRPQKGRRIRRRRRACDQQRYQSSPRDSRHHHVPVFVEVVRLPSENGSELKVGVSRCRFKSQFQKKTDLLKERYLSSVSHF